MIHPQVVHLPIVLAFLRVVLDVAGLLFKRPDLSYAAIGLLGLLVISSLVATVTGQSAFDAAVEAKIDPQLLNTHADNANLVPWAMLAVLVARVVGPLKLKKTGHVLAILLGVLSWWLIYIVGGSGGALVFEHGVGVEARDVKR
jgi:uncharacterized membrane protein